VRKAVGFTLVFEEIHSPNVIGIGVTTGRFVDGYAGEVSLHVAGNAISEVFVIAAIPLADDAELCVGGSDKDQCQQESR
jgi:hypothetical protein